MNAYIRDFVKCEMCADPDGHWACPLFESVYPHGYYCGVNRQEIKDPFSQQPWCPVIPVLPHGQLIDADAQNAQIEALIERFLHGYTRSTWDFVCQLRDILKHAHTIIPADSAEENET